MLARLAYDERHVALQGTWVFGQELDHSSRSHHLLEARVRLAPLLGLQVPPLRVIQFLELEFVLIIVRLILVSGCKAYGRNGVHYNSSATSVALT